MTIKEAIEILKGYFECGSTEELEAGNMAISALEKRDIPAADVVEVRQIQAFIDKLIAERDKYDLHSMRWEHYDCDRLLIEQMLGEIDGERKGWDE